MLDLVFKNYTSQKSPGEIFFTKILQKSLKEVPFKRDLELSVNLVGETKIRSLNKKYRNKDKPTNVLTFPIGNGDGDVFICLSIAKNEAKRENVTIQHKLAQLVVHGFLHLLGYDHERSKKEADEMFSIEKKILGKI